MVSGSGCSVMDVLMDEESGKICQVAEHIEVEQEAVEVLDVSGKLLFPGFIDAHTHFDLEVSGTVTADDFATGTKAAVIGGTTLIIDFATQNKGETLDEALENWHKKADGRCSCDYGFHMAISDWNEDVSRQLEHMFAEGVTSFKLYMTYDAMVLPDEAIYQVLKRLKELNGIAGVHCENMGLIAARVAEEKQAGHLTPDAHPLTRPDLAEAEAVDRLLKLAKAADAPVIVVHLSSEAGYQEVVYARRGKNGSAAGTAGAAVAANASGVAGTAEPAQEIYLETCPQYLVMDDSRYSEDGFDGAKYVCSPPLRKAADQECLWKALATDQIQTISTDHCSFTMEQKRAGIDDFSKIPNGMPGVETRPVLMYTYGVRQGRLTLEQMCRLLAENPAKLYGIYPQKGCIAEGSDADLVVWDPETRWTLSVDNQKAATDYCPLEGMAVEGMPETVYLRGQKVAERGEVVKEDAGQYTRRGTYQKF